MATCLANCLGSGALVLFLAACTTASTTPALTTPVPIDVSEPTSIEVSDVIVDLDWARSAQVPLDGSSRELSRKFSRYFLKESVEASRRAGIAPMSVLCHVKNQDIYRVSRLRGTDYQDEHVTLYVSAGQARVERIEVSWPDDDDRLQIASRTKTLDRNALTAALHELDVIGISQFPAEVQSDIISFHTSVWLIETCIARQQRLTYDSNALGLADPDNIGKGNRFTDAVKLLRSLAD